MTYIWLENDIELTISFHFIVFCDVWPHSIGLFYCIRTVLTWSYYISYWIIDVALTKGLTHFTFRVNKFITNEEISLLDRKHQLKRSLVCTMNWLFDHILKFILMIFVLNLKTHHIFFFKVGIFRPYNRLLKFNYCVKGGLLTYCPWYRFFGLVENGPGGFYFFPQRWITIGLAVELFLFCEVLFAEVLPFLKDIYFVTSPW